MVKIGPSLMCANLARLEEDIAALERGGIDFYHFDIMDGRFVPNFSLSPDHIKTLRPLSTALFDAHLMIDEPERYIDMITAAGANMISIHAESKGHLKRNLQHIKSNGLQAGIALNPSTPLHQLDYIMDSIDYVCLMTVNPGFAGQRFIPATMRKLADLKDKIKQSGKDIAIEVDGNISFEITAEVVANGADMLVGGTSSIFSAGASLESNIKQLREQSLT